MSDSTKGPKNGVWVGLKRCGCCVAVCIDDGNPKYRKHVNAAKREFLREGLSVVNATWQDWQEKHMPNMRRTCEHDQANAPAVGLAETQEPGK